MCDYRLKSKSVMDSLNPNPNNLCKVLGDQAYKPLVRKVSSKCAYPGHDLHTGKSLSRADLDKGYYMLPGSFNKELNWMNRYPNLCAWCGKPLPKRRSARHMKPHNHREEIDHHHHSRCWNARMLAVAVIFGHTRPDRLKRKRRSCFKLKKVIIQKTYHRRNGRRW